MSLKEIVIAFVLISLGIGAGVYVSTSRDAPEVESNTDPLVTGSSLAAGSDPQVLNADALSRKVASLESQVTLLLDRIEELESRQDAVAMSLSDALPMDNGTATPTPDNPPPRAFTGRRGQGQAPDEMIGYLTAAGVDPVLAEDIVRRQGQVELERLELRDQAIRDGSIGTPEFREKMRELRDQDVSIREEVNELAYDRYLYQSGQPNRIAVDSVILGSAAEQNGIQPGDMILRYEGRSVYNHRDLRSATSAGERDELVNVTVARNGSELTVTMPRGPLGVRLSPMFVDPDEDS